MKRRVTGLGGVFFKANDPKMMTSWYAKHLGVEGVFKWIEVDQRDAKEPAQTIWSTLR